MPHRTQPVDPSSAEREERFRANQRRLPGLWKAIHADPTYVHTALVIPSLSVDQEELSKIDGASYYEERLLFGLMRLRHAGAHVIYVTSQPVHPDIVDYYMQLLHGVPANLARQRLAMLCVHDSSPRPLTDKILERPLFLRRLSRLIGRPRRAYITCFNSTARERRLAVELGLPLNAADPELLPLGSKSGSRRVFQEAGVLHPAGFEDLTSREQLVDALGRLAETTPSPRRAIVKLNESFSGEGNGVFSFPDDLPRDAPARQRSIDSALEGIRFGAAGESVGRFLRKLGEMGGIVEEHLEAEQFRSPSVQMRVCPDGRLERVSTHDQMLGGVTGQMYLGCRFPADSAYREEISRAASRIGGVLLERGVLGRFGIDFVALQDGEGPWRCHAIEINLRMGGTTPPFLALQFLTGGRLNEDGSFATRRGQSRYYRATDHLKSPFYRGLLPEDLMELMLQHSVGYDPSLERGVLFHMIGGLSQYGKIGLTCIGQSRDDADRLYDRTVEILDEVSGATTPGHRLAPLLDRPWAGIE